MIKLKLAFFSYEAEARMPLDRQALYDSAAALGLSSPYQRSGALELLEAEPACLPRLLEPHWSLAELNLLAHILEGADEGFAVMLEQYAEGPTPMRELINCAFLIRGLQEVADTLPVTAL